MTHGAWKGPFQWLGKGFSFAASQTPEATIDSAIDIREVVSDSPAADWGFMTVHGGDQTPLALSPSLEVRPALGRINLKL